MRQHLFEQSRKSTLWGSPGKLMKGHWRYDYAFLEQCCNMYARGVANGEITGSAQAFKAIEKIDEINDKYYKQPDFDMFHAKRKAARRIVWDKCEPYSTMIAQELFRIEFEKATEKFSKWSCADVDNLQRHFLSGSMNLDVEVDGETISPPTSCALVDVAKDLEENRFGGFSGEFQYLQNGGFVVEKYIRIEDKAEGELTLPITGIAERADHLYGIVNMVEWKNWLQENDKFKYTETSVDEESGEETDTESSRKINELFKSWSYGLRLSYLPSFHEEASLKNLTNSIDTDVALKHKAFKVEIAGTVGTPLIPIAKTEIEIPGDLRINDFGIIQDYDFECLLDQFLKDGEFRTLFEYVYPLERLLSLPTIYMSHCFLHSIGLDDGWYQDARPEKAEDGPGDPVDGWFDRFMRDWQHREGPGLKTGDWLLFFRGLKKFKSYRNWSKIPFPETREMLRDFFMGEYDHDLRASGRWRLPKFTIKINLPPWGFGPPKWFMNRRYEGPECDDGPGGAAEEAAYNRG